MKKFTSQKTINTYLSKPLLRGNKELFLCRLKEVVEFKGGIKRLAEETGVSRATLYKTLSEEGNPKLETLIKILQNLELTLQVGKV